MFASSIRSPLFRLSQQSLVPLRGFTSAALRRAEGAPLPYHVHRSATNNLPVYYKKKRDGQHKTTLRKLEGNLHKLAADLVEEAGIDRKLIDIKHIKKHIDIRARVGDRVLNFLRRKKF